MSGDGNRFLPNRRSSPCASAPLTAISRAQNVAASAGNSPAKVSTNADHSGGIVPEVSVTAPVSSGSSCARTAPSRPPSRIPKYSAATLIGAAAQAVSVIKIGREPRRERVCQYVEISEVAGPLKKKNKQ